MFEMLKNIFTPNATYDDDDNYSADDELDENSVVQTTSSRAKRRDYDNVVSLSSTDKSKLIIQEPNNFAEAADIIDSLSSRRPVVINLEKCSVTTAQRLVDYLAGAVKALKGQITFVSKRVLIITPCTIDLVDRRGTSVGAADEDDE